MVRDWRHERRQDKDIKKLKQVVLQADVKYNLLSVPQGDIPVTGVAYCLNLISTQVQQTSRIGYKIRPTSVDIRLILQDKSTSTTPPLVRCILFWDSNPNGVFPQLTGDPLQTTAGAGPALLNISPIATPISAVAAHFMQETKDKFHILYDKTFFINKDSTNTYVKGQFIDIHKKLGRTTVYTDDTSSSTAIQKNGLYFAMFCNPDATATASFQSKLNFKDL